MEKIFGIISYNGTNYQGWQTQVDGNTIQDELESVLSRLLNGPIKVYGSGRTDAGVHALGQTFHFVPNKEIKDLKLFLHSINCLLPKDIKVLSLKEKDKDFHARLSAIGKTYIYQFAINEIDVFKYPFVSLIHDPFDMEKFIECLDLFKGEHCFKNFTSKEEDECEYIRTIQDISLSKHEDFYEVTLTGNGFMRYMIRFIIGTAFAYAKGSTTLEKVKDQIDMKITSKTSFKAEAKGLFLKEVLY